MATCDFLCIGAEGTGKTTLLKQLINTSKTVGTIDSSNDPITTFPTNGVELETIVIKKQKYIVREIGGNFLPVWPKFYESCLMLIYMIDMANYAQVPISCIELFNVLSHEHNRGKPVLLLLNKIDQPMAMTRTTIEHLAQLDATLQESRNMHGQEIIVEEISAANNINLDKVLLWMRSAKKQILSKLNKKSV